MSTWTIQLDSQLFERFHLAKSFEEQAISSVLSDADFLARLLEIHAAHQTQPFPVLATIPIVSQHQGTIEPQSHPASSELQSHSLNEATDNAVRFSYLPEYQPTLLSLPYLILPTHMNQPQIAAAQPVLNTFAYTQQSPSPFTTNPPTTNSNPHLQYQLLARPSLHQPTHSHRSQQQQQQQQQQHHYYHNPLTQESISHRIPQPLTQSPEAPLPTGPIVQRFRMAQPLRFAPAWTPKPTGSASPKRAKTQKQPESPDFIVQEHVPNP